MCAAVRPMPRESRVAELAAWRVRRRATESAPPEMATEMRSPGLMLERSKARVGWAGIGLHLTDGESTQTADYPVSRFGAMLAEVMRKMLFQIANRVFENV